jgi:hypothetical protein
MDLKEKVMVSLSPYGMSGWLSQPGPRRAPAGRHQVRDEPDHQMKSSAFSFR